MEKEFYKYLKKIGLRLFVFATLLLNYSFADAQISQSKLAELIQSNYEFYAKVPLNSDIKLSKIEQFGSVDKVDYQQNVAYIYLSPEKLKQLNSSGINFELKTQPSKLTIPQMAKSLESLNSWDVYPTYSQYVEMMQNFAKNYPQICKLDTIGTTVSGRLLLVVKLSDNVQDREKEPEFFYTSTIHGDEVVGAILMLRLIDYLLTNYASNNEVADLLNSMQIYINPFANPDGTYRAGNDNIYGATRYNSNNIDLNRNFPDPDDGQNPDGNATQKETQEMMDFMLEHNFVMSVNFHGGEEVVNYPWDTFSKRHADNDWYDHISRVYADTVHLVNSKYMTFMDNGVTDGYDWYTISGGRQDYSNYYAQCKEVTIELSNDKMPVATELPNYWNYNFRSLIAYLKQSKLGFYGTVINKETQVPVKAKIYIQDYDFDNSFVHCTADGYYVRPLLPGTYNLIAVADGFENDTIKNITLNGNSFTELNFEMKEGLSSVSIVNNTIVKAYPNPANDELFVSSVNEWIKSIEIYSIDGKLEYNSNFNSLNKANINISSLPMGIHILKVYTTRGMSSLKIAKY
jgi:murein tripeptide amidase MpaA